MHIHADRATSQNCTTWEFCQELVRRWHEQEPKKAQGGIDALSGFRYQFYIALLTTLSKISANQGVVQSVPSGVFTEMLSDAMDIDGNTITLIQSKKIAYSSNVSSSISEFWDIWKIAKSISSENSEKINFKIITSRNKFGNFVDYIAKWTPYEPMLAESDLLNFRKQVSFEIDVNPDLELYDKISSLLPGINPIVKCNEWLGKMHSNCIDKARIRVAAEDIWGEIIALKRTSNSTNPICIFNENHLPPAVVDHGKYLWGQRPLLHHLREGYFAPRTRIVDYLFCEFETWTKIHPTSVDTSLRVPIFWIGGRSGCGKSVAMLQLMSKIYLNDIAPIIWAGQYAENIPDAIPLICQLAADHEFSIIAIDDPFSPNLHSATASSWSKLLPTLYMAREHGQYAKIPIFICCGPTEQAYRLMDEYPDDFVVKICEVPTETDRDYEELRDWFLLRTGMAPPEIENNNTLLVQLFFEWKTGEPLKEFAHRFKQRISASGGLDCVDVLSKILSLNRLYIGYPARAIESLVSVELKCVISTLLEENHLGDSMSAERYGLWLAHPHLSNLIYNAWYTQDRHSHARRKHLLDSVIDVSIWEELASQKQAPLWSLSRSILFPEKEAMAVERLVGIDLVDLFERVYEILYSDHLNDVPTWALPVWIQIAAALPDLSLKKYIIESARKALTVGDISQTGLRLVCHKLIQHRQRIELSIVSEFDELVCTLLKN
ncbi:MAG: hypothetical protein Q8O19_03055, partial [Rectinemataceae bacterium]|nr:hypothetical protein [Rectinemataceae bacterium]